MFPQTLPAGPPPAGRFSLDARALRREFLRLQAATHPDLHSSGGGRDSSSSLAATNRSARLNGAYRTLASPLARAQHLLLALHGVDVLAEDAAGPGLRVGSDVLATAMDALAAVEDAQDEADLEAPRRDNDARIDACVAALDDAFAANDVPAAVDLAVRLRYWVNVRDAIAGWERGRGVVLEH